MRTKLRAEHREVEITLDEKDRLAAGIHLAEEVKRLRDQKDHEKTMRDTLKGEKEEIEVAIDKLADVVRTGKRREECDVIEWGNHETSEVEVCREDGTVLSTRKMTAVERQLSIPGEEPGLSVVEGKGRKRGDSVH